MLIPNHPDDERLSALASHDDDAIQDAVLRSHVSTCVRCTGVVDELGALRASLADLPDLAPGRALRLLPPVADAAVTAGSAGWMRRLFAPAITAGAALAMVGLVGTASPLLSSGPSGAAPFTDADAGAEEAAASELQQVLSSDRAAAPAAGGETDASEAEPGGSPEAVEGRTLATAAPEEGVPSGGDDFGTATDRQLPAERSPWPMVLFTGIALMVAAALLRWVLVPRAG